jgi:hypothetical protein
VRHLFIVLAVAALAACGAPAQPGGGPTLPNGARPLALKQLSLLGPTDAGPDIIASTSLAQVRDGVIAHSRYDRMCTLGAGPGDRCWSQVPDEPGHVYVAVITAVECTRPTKEATGIGGSTLYFIHWIGPSQGVCNMAMVQASWRLFSVSRGDLPKSGTLTVRLEFQGSDSSAVETQVPLT